LDEVALLHLLALVEAQSPEGEDVDSLAGLLCGLAYINEASFLRDVPSPESKAAAQGHLMLFRTWLNGSDSDTSWFRVLPSPNVEFIIKSYSRQPSDAQILQVADQLKQLQPPQPHPLIVTNEDGVCVFVFPQTTSTADIARLLCCIIGRMRLECGRDYPWDDDDEEIALHCYLLGVVKAQGYRRYDGLVGIRDEATRLPLSFGGTRFHPLACSLAAHARHGEAFSLTPDRRNICVDSKAMNWLPGSWRFSLICAVIDDMLPTLQLLRNRLVEGGGGGSP